MGTSGKSMGDENRAVSPQRGHTDIHTNSDPARGSSAPASPARLAWPSTASCAMTLHPSTASLPVRGEA